jgi:hypothetical protein
MRETWRDPRRSRAATSVLTPCDALKEKEKPEPQRSSSRLSDVAEATCSASLAIVANAFADDQRPATTGGCRQGLRALNPSYCARQSIYCASSTKTEPNA